MDSKLGSHLITSSNMMLLCPSKAVTASSLMVLCPHYYLTVVPNVIIRYLSESSQKQHQDDPTGGCPRGGYPPGGYPSGGYDTTL